MKTSQKSQILQFMKRYRSITPMEAIDLCGCMRLAPRVMELRAEGHTIRTDMIRRGRVIYAKYVYVR